MNACLFEWDALSAFDTPGSFFSTRPACLSHYRLQNLIEQSSISGDLIHISCDFFIPHAGTSPVMRWPGSQNINTGFPFPRLGWFLNKAGET